MTYHHELQRVSPATVKKIHECLFQAVGEDYQEAEGHLELKTHISRPFLIWDLINRNLINVFSESNVLYSVHKRGMWELLLLYEPESRLVLSFMRDKRFEVIKKEVVNRRPQYIRALLLLNEELQAQNKQQQLFPVSTTTTNENREQLISLLDIFCEQFTNSSLSVIKHHALVVFSSNFGEISSLKAYVLDKDLDVVDEQDWLKHSKPIISNTIEQVAKDEKGAKQLKLTDKALRRKHKELVALKEDEKDKEN